MDAIVIERAIWVKAPIERVWQAITQPEQLKKWYAPGCDWEIPRLQAGAPVKFHNTETDIQLATIEVVDAPRQLRLRWQADATNSEAALNNTFWLAEENGGTRVTITQTGYESLPADQRQSAARAEQSRFVAQRRSET